MNSNYGGQVAYDSSQQVNPYVQTGYGGYTGTAGSQGGAAYVQQYAYGNYGGQPTQQVPTLSPMPQNELKPKIGGNYVVAGRRGAMQLGADGFLSEKNIKAHQDRLKILLEPEADITTKLGNKAPDVLNKGPVLQARAGPAWYDEKGELIAASTLTAICDCVIEYRANLGKPSASSATNKGNRPTGYMISYAHVGIPIFTYEFINESITKTHGFNTVPHEKAYTKDGRYWNDCNIDAGVPVSLVVEQGAGTQVCDTPGQNGTTFLGNAKQHLLCNAMFEMKLRRDARYLQSHEQRFYVTYALRGYAPIAATDFCGTGLAPVSGMASTGATMSRDLAKFLTTSSTAPPHSQMGNNRLGAYMVPSQPMNYTPTGEIVPTIYNPTQPNNFVPSPQLLGGGGNVLHNGVMPSQMGQPGQQFGQQQMQAQMAQMLQQQQMYQQQQQQQYQQAQPQQQQQSQQHATAQSAPAGSDAAPQAASSPTAAGGSQAPSGTKAK